MANNSFHADGVDMLRKDIIIINGQTLPVDEAVLIRGLVRNHHEYSEHRLKTLDDYTDLRSVDNEFNEKMKNASKAVCDRANSLLNKFKG